MNFTEDELANEEWRPIVGHPGYRVSSLGRIHSLRPLQKTAPTIHCGTINKSGYPVTSLRIGPGVRTVAYIHRLVAIAFIGPEPDGKEVCHKDGDPSNCRSSNLIWGTHEENMSHCDAHGTRQHGMECEHAKLREQDVMDIITLSERGMQQHLIAAAYGVTQTAVSMIVLGKNWSRLTGRTCRKPSAFAVAPVSASGPASATTAGDSLHAGPPMA